MFAVCRCFYYSFTSPKIRPVVFLERVASVYYSNGLSLILQILIRVVGKNREKEKIFTWDCYHCCKWTRTVKSWLCIQKVPLASSVEMIALWRTWCEQLLVCGGSFWHWEGEDDENEYKKRMMKNSQDSAHKSFEGSNKRTIVTNWKRRKAHQNADDFGSIIISLSTPAKSVISIWCFDECTQIIIF